MRETVLRSYVPIQYEIFSSFVSADSFCFAFTDYTAATFGYENVTDSLVTVIVTDTARRAVRNIVDISMFIKTRQPRGQIFYLGSALGSLNEETYIAAQLEGGELLMRVHFNGTTEAYTVGGVKLNNGYNHLIQVINISYIITVV